MQRNLTIVTLACVVVVVLFTLYGYRNEQLDDSYIFYSYAQNLANGNGYVFNIGQRVNATTSPLYTILLALLHRALRVFPFVTIPLIGHLIGVISLFFLCFFLMRCFESERASLFPFVLPLVFLASPLLPKAVGMETFLAMMLGVICLSFYARERLLAASLACSFAVLARPDMVLLAAVLVIYDFLRNRRIPTLRMVFVFLLPIVVWLAFSLAYFGKLLPSTVSAKLVQSDIGLWGPGLVFWQGLLSRYAWYGGHAVRDLLAISVLMGAVVMVLKFRHWSVLWHPVLHLILLWNLVYLVAYGLILNAPAYSWYYAPLSLGITLIITLPLEGFYRLFSNNTERHWIALPLIYLALLLADFVFPFVGSRQPISPIEQNYKMAAEWLNANARPGSSVGTNCIGTLRYFYKKGPVIDGAGLVTPEVVEHLKRRDYNWYVHHYRPNYLLFQHPPYPTVEGMVYEEWFRKEYTLRKVFRSSRHAAAIYERQGP
ncbi:MAG: hypothetical protein V1784_05545 [bacterium]